jgi:hypothetical protein
MPLNQKPDSSDIAKLTYSRIEYREDRNGSPHDNSPTGVSMESHHMSERGYVRSDYSSDFVVSHTEWDYFSDKSLGWAACDFCTCWFDADIWHPQWGIFPLGQPECLSSRSVYNFMMTMNSPETVKPYLFCHTSEGFFQEFSLFKDDRDELNISHFCCQENFWSLTWSRLIRP